MPRMDPPDYSVGDLAFDLELMQVSPEGFGRLLRLAHTVTPWNTPAALTDASPLWRVGACAAGEEGRFSGAPVGTYLGFTILAWRKSDREREAERGLWRIARRPGA